MNEKDTSLYGKNREGKVALCETCAYDGYCRDKIRYYRCRNYIKIKDDYDKNEKNVTMKTKEEIEAHRRTCEHFNTTLLGDGRTCCTADLRALPTWQDPGGDGMVYPCGDDCPFMKQFINEDKDEDIETNHSDGRA